MKTIKKVYDIWKVFSLEVAPTEPTVNSVDLNALTASIFCPGPWYSYVFDIIGGEFTTVHQNAEQYYGIKAEDISIKDYVERIHPDDQPFFLGCERLVSDFLTQHIEPDTMFKYKFVYTVRFLDKDGNYRHLLHQAIAFSRGPNGNMTASMGIHSFIDHLNPVNNYQLSIIGLDGYPSYLGIDVLFEHPKLEILSHPFSQREIEIIRMISEGLTSKEIAGSLFLSTDTVRTHRQNILKKAGCHNTSELISSCFRQGIL